ncbi:hypothetical protein [Legionella norrlandica]|nr:hypothetical protein [Legionella norrlandica]
MKFSNQQKKRLHHIGWKQQYPGTSRYGWIPNKPQSETELVAVQITP